MRIVCVSLFLVVLSVLLSSCDDVAAAPVVSLPVTVDSNTDTAVSVQPVVNRSIDEILTVVNEVTTVQPAAGFDSANFTAPAPEDVSISSYDNANPHYFTAAFIFQGNYIITQTITFVDSTTATGQTLVIVDEDSGLPVGAPSTSTTDLVSAN